MVFFTIFSGIIRQIELMGGSNGGGGRRELREPVTDVTIAEHVCGVGKYDHASRFEIL